MRTPSSVVNRDSPVALFSVLVEFFSAFAELTSKRPDCANAGAKTRARGKKSKRCRCTVRLGRKGCLSFSVIDFLSSMRNVFDVALCLPTIDTLFTVFCLPLTVRSSLFTPDFFRFRQSTLSERSVPPAVAAGSESQRAQRRSL